MKVGSGHGSLTPWFFVNGALVIDHFTPPRLTGENISLSIDVSRRRGGSPMRSRGPDPRLPASPTLHMHLSQGIEASNPSKEVEMDINIRM